jgi:hypothetical protein
MGKKATDKKTADKLFKVSNYPTGPWEGSPKWVSREVLLDNDADNDDQVASFLDDDGTESDWYVRHPDGRVEILSYFGEHRGWHDE